MTHIPNKRQRKEESLNSMYRLRLPARAKSTGNLCTQKAGRQSLCLLTPILIIFALIISISCSGGAETKSSLAEITELIVTINSIDYPISFDANKAATVTIPYGSTLPKEITVKTAAISAKATGLAAGDTLKISSGQAVITITAEDGSTTAYTLNIETEPKSSQSGITELTVTINSIDYTITFDENNVATVTIPYVSTLPTEIMVKTAAISAKAAGLAAGDTLKISSGKADITVTAEDGTTTAHTLNVEISPLKLTNQELGDRWGLFQVVLDEEDTLYHFGVIPAGEQVPEKSEMESDLNVKKYIVGRNPINIILATTMKSPLLPFFDAVTDNASAKAIWTDTDVSFNGANIMKGDNEFAAKRSLLAPETAHKVYALEDGGNSVHIIHEFTTAAVDLTSGSPDSPPYLAVLSSKLQTETLTFHINNYEIFPLQMKASLANDTPLFPIGTAAAAAWEQTPTTYWSAGSLALNPSVFPKDNRPEFYFYAGETADYGNSPRLLSLRGLFMTVKGWTNADPVFPMSQVHDTEGSTRFTPTINYQQ